MFIEFVTWNGQIVLVINTTGDLLLLTWLSIDTVADLPGYFV